MQRYKATIEYKGTNFVGWQKQAIGLSVQEVIEKSIHSFSGEHSQVYAAGRTDSGVHALGQVCHFDLNKKFDEKEIQGALNHYVKPSAISILNVEKVDEQFHARFSAKFRSYVYKIINRKAPLAIMNNLAWHVIETLDTENMHKVAQVLIGTNDLTSFRSTHCQAKNPIRSIDMIDVKKVSKEEINIFIKAPSFLHNQVRIITGCLYKAGLGELDQEGMKAILDVKDRTKAAFTAPPEGLYLYEVGY